MSMRKVAGVAVQNASFSFDKLYDYLVPETLAVPLTVGCRVLVPFGRGSSVRQGIVLSLKDEQTLSADHKFKEIAAVLDEDPLVSPNMVKLAEYMKAHTFCTLFDAIKTMLPAGVNLRTTAYFAAVPETEDETSCTPEECQVLEFLRRRQGYVKQPVILTECGLSPESGLLDEMAVKGLLVKDYDADRVVGDATVRMIRTVDALQSEEDFEEFPAEFTKKQLDVLQELFRVGTCSVKEICYFTGVTEAVIKALIKKEAVEIYEKEVFRRPFCKSITDREEIQLTSEQQKAYENLLKQTYDGGGTSLLFGVTGSGKTQVYLKLIDAVRKAGKGVIVMVPEISLTPQTLKLFYARYGDEVAVFHSALSQGERLDEWRRVKECMAHIAVGTRSAVFAPVENLGLIIMDEEQEHTYRSDQSPRYHARDIARYRCGLNKALLLLASATPSMESYAAAMAGKYTFNKLSDRYGEALLPEVRVIDMKNERSKGNVSRISRALYSELMKNQDEQHQSILLMNRRGYNTYAECNACGAVASCPNCSISLTYHRANRRLMCHYCGYSIPFSTTCSSCGADDVRYSGMGTQKVEEELQELLPEARILRMDADTTMQKNAYEEKLGAFRRGEYDIMLGTQMVAKGLDFENVTLVGILSADNELYNDDYKSMERTFGLLTQVIGRAGRGRFPGKAVIQTLNPDNEVIRLASKQDYESFFNKEITLRRAMVYPPYCQLFSISFRGPNPTRTRDCAEAFMAALRDKGDSISEKGIKLIALGPMPERVYRVCGKYRYRIVLKSRNTEPFRNFMGDILKDFGKRKEASGISIIVEPES